MKLPTILQTDIGGNLLTSSRHSIYFYQVQFRATGLQSDSLLGAIHSLELPINEVFNTFKDKSWVRRPKLIQPNPSLLGSKELLLLR